MTRQTPTVGRDVHYVSHGTPRDENGRQVFTSECRAAKITLVRTLDPDVVDLAVFNPTGMFFGAGNPYDPGLEDWELTPADMPRTELCCEKFYAPGTWHWPEIVPARTA